MFRLDWANPKISLGEFHSYLGTLLGAKFDGLVEDQGYLYINTFEPLDGTEENAILEYVYLLNTQPREVTTQADKTATKDVDGSVIIRPKAAKAGWTYHFTAPEFTTSTINSLYHKDVAGTDLNQCTVKYYDASGTELTAQGSCDTDCVKTVFSFEPAWDYEIIGGTIKTVGAVTENVRIWVIAVPDIPAAYGGSKVMVQSVNLKFIDPNNGVEADGRASKFMTYSSTLHTNKLQLILKHPAGHKEDIMMAFELYRA
jgi:hypothetical protein